MNTHTRADFDREERRARKFLYAAWTVALIWFAVLCWAVLKIVPAAVRWLEHCS